MNLTLSLIAGLTLLLPGLTALATWNLRGAAEGGAGPELPLTSVSALFVILSISAVLHLVGYWLSHWVWEAAVELPSFLPPRWPTLPIAPEPYDTLWQLISNQRAASSLTSPPTLQAVAGLAIVILVECLFAARAATSPLLQVLLDGRDMRGQGWVFQNIVRPRRHGYEPFAYVLTAPPQGNFGLGYQGMVVEVRQTSEGQLKSICLSEPEVFLYEIRGAALETSRKVPPPPGVPRLKLHERRWLGGVVAVDGNAVRNIVVHHIPADIIKAFDEQLQGDIPETAP